MSEFSGDFIQLNEKKKKREGKSLALYLTTHITLYILLIFFAIFFTWYTVFVTTHDFYEVHGPSMMPTFNVQIGDETASGTQDKCFDAVYIDKSTKPKAFDIIVIQEERTVVKRYMAGEGDLMTIAFDKTGVVHFYRIPNKEDPTTYEGAMLLEDGSENGYRISGREVGKEIDAKNDLWSSHLKAINNNGLDFIKIGDYSYTKNFVKNYLKLNSSDLEKIGAGTFSREDIFIAEDGLIYVEVPQGKFFYLGDNRINSEDSMMAADFENVSKIVGRGDVVVKNYNFTNRLWEVIKFYFSQIEKFFAK